MKTLVFSFLLTATVNVFGQVVIDKNYAASLSSSELITLSTLHVPNLDFPSEKLDLVIDLEQWKGEYDKNGKRVMFTDTVHRSMTWQALGQNKLASFMHNIRSYDSDSWNLSSIACGYGVFGIANFGQDLSNDMHSPS